MSVAFPSIPDDGYMTVDRAAAYLNCSRSTLYKYMDTEGLPFYDFAGRRLRKTQIDAWMDEREIVNSTKNGVLRSRPPQLTLVQSEMPTSSTSPPTPPTDAGTRERLRTLRLEAQRQERG